MDVDTPRQIGESKLAVTPFGFGGGTIGSPDVANAAALDTVQASWDIGVRFFGDPMHPLHPNTCNASGPGKLWEIWSRIR